MKQGQGNRFSFDSREIIRNVDQFCKLEREKGLQISLKQAGKRVNAMTGVSRATIARICKKDPEPKPKPRVKPLDDFDKGVVRRTINGMFVMQSKLPTLKNIKSAFLEDIGYQRSNEHLRQLLMELGFKYRKCRTSRSVLMERSDILVKRIQFLRELKRLREEGYYVVYTDETYVHSHHTVPKCWQDDSGIGLKIPFSKGERMIVLHAGGENGFIPGAELVWKAHTSSGDYHNEMNHKNFMTWLNKQLMPNLPDKSVVILDNASYHNVEVDRLPASRAIKCQMMGWLERHHIRYNPTNMLRADLQLIAKQHAPLEPVYVVDSALEARGHKALRLPPYHADLNAIQLIWGDLKGYIARRNLGCKLTAVKALIEEGLSSITAAEWDGCIRHVKGIENKYWETDIDVDKAMDKFIIELTSDSESDSATDTASEFETDTASEGEAA